MKKNIISLVSLIISIIFFGYGYINFSKHYISKNISYLRQDVKPLLQKIINKDKNENVYIYYGSISTYCYYSLLYNIPKNVRFAHYPENENLSEIFLQQDIKNLPKGIYYLLFIKGTSTYEKDINFIEPWLKSKYEIIETNTLKSTKLIKIKIN